MVSSPSKTYTASPSSLDGKGGKDAPRWKQKEGIAAKYYKKQHANRQPYLDRAYRLSKLTVPTLFREEDTYQNQQNKGNQNITVPWNSVGAYLCNNLAAKVVFALFPAGRPNVKLAQDTRTKQDLAQLPEDERADVELVIEKGFSAVENQMAEMVEEDGDRARMFVAALSMIIGGNHSLQCYPDGTFRGIPLSRYVCNRDAQGNLLRWGIMDVRDWATIDEETKEAIMASGHEKPPEDEDSEHPVNIYTYGYLKKGKWEVFQEVCGVVIPGSEATYNREPGSMPYLFLPWILLDGEDYGRSYAEMYEGDLLTAEDLTKTISEGSAILARMITLVNPTGMTNKRQLSQARNGDVITGRESDVHTLTSNKSADLRVAETTTDKALQRLGQAFLLNSSARRDGERVTAEEIRYVAQELEDGLGGVYSQQIVTWQTPYATLKLKRLMAAKRLPQLPKGAYKLTVTAGLAALGRNVELQNLRTWVSILGEAVGPQSVQAMLGPKMGPFADRVAVALGINTEGLLPTEEELEAQAQQGQQQQLLDNLGPEALRQLGNNITSNQVAETQAAGSDAPPQDSPPPQQ